MKLNKLTDAYLEVEFSDEDSAEFAEDFDVELPGRVFRVPGCWKYALSGQGEGAFCALADEMRSAPEVSGPFSALGSDGERKCLVAEAICSHWPDFGTDCDIRFYGEDGSLWCCNERGFEIVVAAPRSSAVLWTLLTLMVVAAEVALTVVLAILEGVYGAVFINVLLIPFVVVCAVCTVRSWRFRVTASLRGITVKPTFGKSWSFALTEIVRVDEVLGEAPLGTVRRLTIYTPSRQVTLRGSMAGVEELDAFLISYTDAVGWNDGR